jgi:hypothetical protein
VIAITYGELKRARELIGRAALPGLRLQGDRSQLSVFFLTHKSRSGPYVRDMSTDSVSRYQSLLAELEIIDQNGVTNSGNRIRRSEILQSILELFSANLENNDAEQSAGPACELETKAERFIPADGTLR